MEFQSREASAAELVCSRYVGFLLLSRLRSGSAELLDSDFKWTQVLG